MNGWCNNEMRFAKNMGFKKAIVEIGIYNHHG
jgi:hypothetical protein